jgi:hypothetical protein
MRNWRYLVSALPGLHVSSISSASSSFVALMYPKAARLCVQSAPAGQYFLSTTHLLHFSTSAEVISESAGCAASETVVPEYKHENNHILKTFTHTT